MGKDWRRESHDAHDKKETKEMDGAHAEWR